MSIKSESIPQANEITKIIKIPSLILEGKVKPQQISDELQFTSRQANYYVTAASLLGLVEKKDGTVAYSLTALGSRFVVANAHLKKEIILSAVLHLPIMKRVLAREDSASRIFKSVIAQTVREETGLSASTAMRRADTLYNWLFWIAHHFPHLFEAHPSFILRKNID